MSAFVESLKSRDPRDKGKKKILTAETRGIQSVESNCEISPSLEEDTPTQTRRRLDRAPTLVLQASQVTAGTIDSLVDHLTDVYSIAGNLDACGRHNSFAY